VRPIENKRTGEEDGAGALLNFLTCAEQHCELQASLAGLGHFVHRAQAACTDIDVLRDAIDWQATMLDVQHKSPVRMPFRVTDIAPVLWLSQTDIAASGSHTLHPLYFDNCFPVSCALRVYHLSAREARVSGEEKG
jgi:hypothetical protein